MNFYLSLPTTIQRGAFIVLSGTTAEAHDGVEHRLTIEVAGPDSSQVGQPLTALFTVGFNASVDADRRRNTVSADLGVTVGIPIIVRIPAVVVGMHSIEIRVDDADPYILPYRIGTREQAFNARRFAPN